jgi:hypothetical protein
MPSGPPICALRASPRRTSDSGCSGWPTPTTGHAESLENWQRRKVKEYEKYPGKGMGSGSLAIVAQLAGWATPASRDWRDGRASQETMDRNSRPLNEQVVMLAGWATPTAHEKVRSELFRVGRELNAKEALMPGPNSISSPAGTASRGVLNPAHSRWLQGYPATWDDCAVTETRSSRKSRRSS